MRTSTELPVPLLQDSPLLRRRGAPMCQLQRVAAQKFL